VKNELYTISIEQATHQTTHQDSVEKIWPAAHFISEVLSSAHFVSKKIWLAAGFFHKKIFVFNHFVVHLISNFLCSSTNSSVG